MLANKLMSRFPPVAAKIPFTHLHHGRASTDSYHWLKDQNEKKLPNIIAHLDAENKYTELIHLVPHAEIIKQIYTEIISKINEDDQSVPVWKAPYWYYSRTETAKQYKIHCRKTIDGQEQVVLDLNQLQHKHEYMDLGSLEVSPDHTTLAFALDLDGSELYDIFIKKLHGNGNIEANVLKKNPTFNEPIVKVKSADEKIDILEAADEDQASIRKTGGDVEWFNDNQTLFYTTRDKTQRSYQVWRHTLDKTEEPDVLIYQEDDEKFAVGIYKSASEKFIYLTTSSSLTSETRFFHADNPKDLGTVFLPRQYNHLYEVEHQNDRFIILSNSNQKLNFAVYGCALEGYADQSKWIEIRKYDPMIHIISVTPFKSHLVLYECSSNGYKQIRILGGHGIDKVMQFDQAVYSVSVGNYSELSYDSSVLRYRYESMITPSQVWEIEMDTGARKLLKKTELPGLDESKYEIVRVQVPISPENQVLAPFDTPVPTHVPVSLVYRKDLFKMDGMSPLYLYGYGSYGISIDAGWSPSRFSLLDRGIVYAIAHIRGGGDAGRAWYESGKFKNKKNSFIDFISCADYLVENRWTSNDLLAIEGRSAGGVLNQRPDLCRVAVAGVPFVDVINTMMDASIPLTINEYEEWGDPNQIDFFEYMLSYSPYENIPTSSKKWPHILVKAGLNDPRVQYWEPAKWVAKLREVQAGLDEDERTCVVFDCKMGSGHFGSSGRYAYYEEVAADYGFVVTMLENSRIDKVAAGIKKLGTVVDE